LNKGIKMTGLMDASPTAVQHHEGSINFYYGVHPHKIQYLPAQAEFMVVYSPKDGDGWELVKYKMFSNDSGMAVTMRRDLNPEEIVYFETLSKNSKLDTGTSAAVGGASV
jgi:hypothetical protein